MKHFGFTYYKRQKSYLSDKHEDEENVTSRKKITKTYFRLETCTYRWVQIDEDLAKEMENDELKSLAKNICYEYEINNRKMREYHVDSQPDFQAMNHAMSVRCSPNAKQLVILGQDESCFKQYTFSKCCWVGPGGEMKLLPKTDRYTLVVSAFVSREFGFGLELTDDELRRVNERRQSREWCKYMSKEEAISVNGTEKKRLITDSLTLVQFVDVGINEEGYWNHNHRALQVRCLRCSLY